jgi:hypothetical protein
METVSIVTKRFIVYDNNGTILSIQNSEDKNNNNLVVDLKEVTKFLDGSDSFTKYRVEYDFIEKVFRLVSMKQYQETFMRESFLYKIPTIGNENPDIKVIQDNVNLCWKLEIDPELPLELQGKSINIDPKTQFYSVTKKNDPNVLYTILNFDDSLEIPFDSNFQFDNKQVSVYTMRKFNLYKHEVIND